MKPLLPHYYWSGRRVQPVRMLLAIKTTLQSSERSTLPEAVPGKWIGRSTNQNAPQRNVERLQRLLIVLGSAV